MEKALKQNFPHYFVHGMYLALKHSDKPPNQNPTLHMLKIREKVSFCMV
jgi:hypothetical protein